MDLKSGLYIQRCTQPKVTKEEKKQNRESYSLKLDQDKKILYLINKRASLAFSSRRS
jgi:hypothetical protein